MSANVCAMVINLGVVAAATYLVVHGHPWFAAFLIFGALATTQGVK